MLVTDRDDWDAVFRSLRNQGRDAFNAWLNHTRLGYNYRLEEMSAALGLAQLIAKPWRRADRPAPPPRPPVPLSGAPISIPHPQSGEAAGRLLLSLVRPNLEALVHEALPHVARSPGGAVLCCSRASGCSSRRRSCASAQSSPGSWVSA